MSRLELTGLVTAGHAVVSFAGRDKHRCSTWNCVCNHCGSEYVARADYAQMNTPCPTCARKQAGLASRKHGFAVRGAEHKMLRVWTGIKQRCYNPKKARWYDYGGRGIRMHEPWITDVAAFVEYVTSLPHYGEDGRTLDRVDNDGDYEPGNLRWATGQEQQRNTRYNRYITHNGETRTLSEWAKLTGLGPTFVSRFRKGDTGDRLFNPGKQPRGKLYAHNGEKKTLREWETILGVPYSTLYWRAKDGKPLMKGVTP